MNTEYKRKWVDALRSGKYRQGVGVLKNANEEYCCLGVLCDILDVGKFLYVKDLNKFSGINTEGNSSGYIFVDKDVELEDIANDFSRDFTTSDSLSMYSVGALPMHVKSLVGLGYSEESDLIDMNDNGSSFEEIAEWIETNL